jgi:hypothetical protein
MKRPRFTVRRMMVAVAVVAMILGIGLAAKRLQERRTRALALAKYFRSREDKERRMLGLPEFRSHLASLGPDARRDDLRDREKEIERHGLMRLRYERASRYPWLPMEPDPPEPK